MFAKGFIVYSISRRFYRFNLILAMVKKKCFHKRHFFDDELPMVLLGSYLMRTVLVFSGVFASVRQIYDNCHRI